MKQIVKLFMAGTCVLALGACRNDIDYDACGQIEAVQITVSAESNGKILSLDVEEGDNLHQGQILGAVDSVQTWLQIQELQQRKTGAESKLIDIKKQQAPQISQLESLENDYRRFSALHAKEAASQKQVDDISSQINTLKAQMSAQEQTWTRNNQSIASEISTYNIQLAQKQDQLSKCRISSPIDGTVLTKYAQAGENITTGKPLFKIADLSNVFVRAYFTTEQLGSLKLSDTLTVIPDDGSASPKKYTGTLTWISEQAEFTPKNIQTRNERADLVYATKISIPNDGYLRLGMYAYIKIEK